MRIPIEDEAGVAITDFTGWEVGVWIFDALKDNRAALGTGAVISKPYSGGDVDLGTEPNADVAIVPVDTVGLKTKNYWYECYRTDTGFQTRLAYGIWPLID
ncbi:MAG: hypothetical protein ACSLE3_07155 [Microbacteriaceae bacterium]